MWFDILKVLGTKSGYAQLDFDNIVVEEETNCKKRFQEICNAFRKFTKQEFKINNFGTEILDLVNTESSEDSAYFDEPKGMGIRKVDVIFSAFVYDPKIPEEVYCKALEVFDEIWASKAAYEVDTPPDIDIGDYTIRPYKYQHMKGLRIFKRRRTYRRAAAIYFGASFGDNSKIILNNQEFTQDELFKKVRGIL
tara:strand:- start:1435 stop:2016 length:582 start_codon:yes stop_codon:yes gene_type:complete